MIKKQLEAEVKNVFFHVLGLENVEINLEHSGKESFGDFTTSVVIRISKDVGQSAQEIAKRIISELYKSNEIKNLGVEKIEAAGPGFINFYLKQEIFLKEIEEIISQGQNYGWQASLAGTKIMVEYTDPNPFKEFHVGHLYSNIVGESLCRLLESQGATVWRVNYQGDVGLHVAKSLWGMGKLVSDEPREDAPLGEKAAFMGRSYALGSSAFEEDGQAKAEITQLNKKIYERDSSVVELWKKGKRWSLDYFESIYQRLSTNYGKTPAFNRYYPESEAGEEGTKLVKEGLAKGIFDKGEGGAIIFPGEKYGLHTRVFINSLGLPTYEAKELGLAPTKYRDFAYDQSIIVTGNEIDEYFKVLLKALSLINPELGAKTKHISHGMVRLPEGKMSSRTGKVIRGEWLLDEAGRAALKIINESSKDRKAYENEFKPLEVAETVGLGAVKYAFLKSSLGRQIEFDFGQSVSFDGNSGPYLQYTYARAMSVIHKSQITNNKNQTNSKIQNSNPPLLFDAWKFRFVWDLKLGAWDFTTEELTLLRTLYKFPEVVEAAAFKYEPSQVCNFLFDLAQKFNLFYNNVPILKDKSQILTTKSQTTATAESPTGGTNSNDLGFGPPAGEAGIWDFRLALTVAVAQVIKNGLHLLGIEAPERM